MDALDEIEGEIEQEEEEGMSWNAGAVSTALAGATAPTCGVVCVVARCSSWGSKSSAS